MTMTMLELEKKFFTAFNLDWAYSQTECTKLWVNQRASILAAVNGSVGVAGIEDKALESLRAAITSYMKFRHYEAILDCRPIGLVIRTYDTQTTGGNAVMCAADGSVVFFNDVTGKLDFVHMTFLLNEMVINIPTMRDGMYETAKKGMKVKFVALSGSQQQDISDTIQALAALENL